jgi:hypothetical protein
MYRVRRFERDYSDVKLHEFYQLPNTEHENVKIKTAVVHYEIFVTIDYVKKPRCPCFHLPPEIVHHIKKYLPDYLHLELKLSFNEDYPFKSHHWEMVALRTNLPHDYKEMIFSHNHYTKTNWSPAMSIEKDLLVLVIDLLSDFVCH